MYTPLDARLYLNVAKAVDRSNSVVICRRLELPMFYIENIQILTIEVDILVIPTTSFVKKRFDVRKLELEKDHLTIRI